ncbi:MAG: hypothetical protein ACK5M1_04690 [Xanthomarina gelatinilytica]|uniref:hypothetical protein n=1 Tax=Xanthomarina gelatinilytica TaxID=1137281 RepID=UPI003A8A3D2F
MENNTEHLMKHFASVLRGRALGKLKAPSIDPNVSRYFSRKQLIDIIKKRFDGSIPKEHNLAEMEKEELVALVGDEMYIISYVTESWSKELSEKKTPEKPVPSTPKPEKPKTDDKKDTKTGK